MHEQKLRIHFQTLFTDLTCSLVLQKCNQVTVLNEC